MFKKTIMIFGLAAIFSVSNISLAQTTSTAASSSSKSSSLSSSSKKGIDLTCAQTAVDNRENDLISARTVQSNAIVTAYEIRKSSLHDGWGIADKNVRKKTIKSAWKTFNDSIKKINGDWRVAQKAAWAKSEKDAKTCRVKISDSEETGSERNDQQ